MSLRSIEDAQEISTREPLLSSGLEFEMPSAQALGVHENPSLNLQMFQGVQGRGSGSSSSPDLNELQNSNAEDLLPYQQKSDGG